MINYTSFGSIFLCFLYLNFDGKIRFQEDATCVIFVENEVKSAFRSNEITRDLLDSRSAIQKHVS